MPIRSHFQDDQQERTAKSLRLSIVVGALFSILIARLFYLQVVQAQLTSGFPRKTECNCG